MIKENETIDLPGRIVLEAPVYAVEPKGTAYLAILKDANGVAHFWLKDGTYDGEDRLVTLGEEKK